MANPDNTRTATVAPAADPRAPLLEDIWLLTIFAALLATAFPWFISGFNIDFAVASLALLALGAIYVGMTLAAGHGQRGPRWPSTLLNVAGVITLAILWQHAGGLQNPAFLLVFVLPVIASGALSRWQPYLTTILAVLTVAVVAARQDAELRWYAAGRWIVRLIGAGAPAGAHDALLGFYAPVTYDVVLLEVFAILLLACAAATESINNAFGKLLDHLIGARADAASGQEIWLGLLTGLPMPALLVDAESLEIIQASEQAAAFCHREVALSGRQLLDVLPFSQPEPLQALIDGSGGTAPFMNLRLQDDLRIVDVKVSHLLHERRRLALVLLFDVTSAFCVTSALDVSEQAVWVMDPHGKPLWSNRMAGSLFPNGLPPIGTTPGSTPWWLPGFSGRRRLRVIVGDRNYQALCTAVALAGEREDCYVLAVATASAAHLASGATAVVSHLPSLTR
jgi:hypothetical protein